MFALFGLMMAFTFSGAASRFNEKRMLIAEEVNAVEVAYMRVHLVAQEAQPALQDSFRQYLDSRLATYRKLPDMKAASAEMEKSAELREELWLKAVAATQLPHSHPDAGKLLLPAINNMIDVANTRTMALQSHPPSIIFLLLFCLGLACALLVGYRMSAGQRRSWLHILGFTMITSVIVYVALDVEYPRTGLIRLEAADQLLVDLRNNMK